LAECPDISCVSTLYRSEPFVEEFVRRAATALASITPNFEIVLVDDGSPDNSRSLAVTLMKDYPKLRIVELSRNFGHHAAILAGLEASRGRLVFFVDSDLEESPELVIDFFKSINEYDQDVIYGFYSREADPWLRRITSTTFWLIISKITDINIPRNIANVRLMSRQYVDAVLSLPDQNIFIGGIFAWPGFRQKGLNITRNSRNESTSYTWIRRLQLAGKAAIAFSDKPLLFVFATGMSITTLSFLVGIYFFFKWMFNPGAVLLGFTSLIISIWFIGGILIGCIGILGFYIAHIYNQTRARPRYLIRTIYESGHSSKPSSQ
jgi:putative glycosyltransferase